MLKNNCVNFMLTNVPSIIYTMKLEYNNIFEVTAGNIEDAANDKLRSDLMVELHKQIDFSGIPIKRVAHKLGVTFSTARSLTRGEIETFSVSELTTFIERLCKP
ncbi:XRE family transcriptional regulator [Aliiglaciecola aliphaticivorans]